MERLSDISIILTEKTGILTNNKMVVTRMWNFRDTEIDPETVSTQNSKIFSNKKVKNIILQNIICNHNQDIDSSTDECLLKFAENFFLDAMKKRKKYVKPSCFRNPYTPMRKITSIVARNCEDTETGSGVRLYIRGVFDKVLPLCTHYLDENGDRYELTDEIRQKIDDAGYSYAFLSLRTMSLAFRDLSVNEGEEDHSRISDEDERYTQTEKCEGLTFLCLIGFKDTLKNGTVENIQKLTDAGISLKIVTGDSSISALQIAKEGKILF